MKTTIIAALALATTTSAQLPTRIHVWDALTDTQQSQAIEKYPNIKTEMEVQGYFVHVNYRDSFRFVPCQACKGTGNMVTRYEPEQTERTRSGLVRHQVRTMSGRTYDTGRITSSHTGVKKKIGRGSIEKCYACNGKRGETVKTQIPVSRVVIKKEATK